jgi:hypothetical protein
MGLEHKQRAFFSYAREDSSFALRLAADLKTNGANVWLDQLDIRPSQQWDREVEQALRMCSEMLAILSPAAIDSNNVMDEIGLALDERKTVIPVLRTECTVPLRVRRFQYIDFRSDYDLGLQALVRALTWEHHVPAVAAVVGDAAPPAVPQPSGMFQQPGVREYEVAESLSEAEVGTYRDRNPEAAAEAERARLRREGAEALPKTEERRLRRKKDLAAGKADERRVEREKAEAARMTEPDRAGAEPTHFLDRDFERPASIIGAVIGVFILIFAAAWIVPRIPIFFASAELKDYASMIIGGLLVLFIGSLTVKFIRWLFRAFS